MQLESALREIDDKDHQLHTLKQNLKEEKNILVQDFEEQLESYKNSVRILEHQNENYK
jgi:predicted  nucleic acid-binding Zn-ribbon protein